MIEIRREKSGFFISGHAGYSAPGKDIICAAISALLQTLAASIDELTTDRIKTEITAGNAAIVYAHLSEQARLLIDAFFIGVQMIADTYPENVRVIVRAGDDEKSSGKTSECLKNRRLKDGKVI